MPAVRQRLDLLAGSAQQRADIDGQRVGLGRGFERGQGQQVFHDGLHAPRLLVHHGHVLVALFGGQRLGRQLAQRLQEAGEHCQRRAQLVRDVGDEIAPGGFQALDLGDIAGNQQALVAGVAGQVDHHDPLLAVQAQAHQDGFGPVPAMRIGDEFGGAQQVQQVVAAVGRQAQAQVAPRHAVGPVDLEIFVERDHAVGQRLGGGQHALHGFARFGQFACARPRVAIQRRQDVVPGADGRRRRRFGVMGPARHQVQAPAAPQQHGRRGRAEQQPAGRVADQPLGKQGHDRPEGDHEKGAQPDHRAVF
ncbi:Uncharacterised protein [Bordetella pertussis]|nr:Uncharacterised protein [Bordetella pertussis]